MSNNKKNNQKISIWSELSGASIGVGIGLLVIVILAVIFYIFMSKKIQDSFVAGAVKC